MNFAFLFYVSASRLQRGTSQRFVRSLQVSRIQTMATLSVENTLKVSHLKSDSEALADLSSAFLDLDIDGEGLLDQASFLTALRMLGVSIDSKEMENIFEVLDEEGSGVCSVILSQLVQPSSLYFMIR